MEAVITPFTFDVQTDYDETRDADGQTDNIDEAV
jgi:hypothetical protein